MFTRVSHIVVLIVVLLTQAPLAHARQDTSTPPAENDGPPPVALVLHPAGQGTQSFFDVEMNGGEQLRLSVVAGNDGSETVPTLLYVADAYTLRNGGFGLFESESTKNGPATWVDLATEELQLESGSRIERTFMISVPEGTPPGEYMTGIAMETKLPSSTPEATEGVTFRIENQYRVVRAIRVTVPGPIEPGLEIGNISTMYLPSDIVVVVDVINIGNVLNRPSGAVQIKDEDGNVVVAGEVSLTVVYAGHTAQLWLPLGRDFPAGNYSVSISLGDQALGVSDEAIDQPIAVESSGSAQSTLAIESASATAAPSEAEIQIANIVVSIRNSGEAISNARLTLVAYLDGIEVDRFAVNQSLAIPNGLSEVSTRFTPITGWSSGEWTFELLLETVQPNGTATVASRLTLEDSIVVP